MAAISFKIEGTERFKAKLRDLQNAGQGREAQQIARAGAQVIVDEAKQIVHVLSGDLRESIHVEDADDNMALAVAGMPYAADEEYGNSRRGPHPYMRPAVDTGKSRARTIMRGLLYVLIKKAAQ